VAIIMAARRFIGAPKTKKPAPIPDFRERTLAGWTGRARLAGWLI